MNDIQTVLNELGYKLTPDSGGWRTNAVFRGGDNPTAIKIFAEDGSWIDFVQGTRGKFEDLVALSLGDKVKAQAFLKGKIDISVPTHNYANKIKIPEIFDESMLQDLIPDFSYWESRDIKRDIAEIFKGGLCLEPKSFLGKLKNRQVLVIYNGKKQIIGLTGRSIDNRLPKWKHIGAKSNWIWPGYLNSKLIKAQRKIILVESPGDVLKMWSCGIHNVICLFGTECSFAILNFLLKTNPHIVISTNNESSAVGNHAAEKIYNRLKRYFNHNQLQIILPYKKDFGEMSCEEIYQWSKDNSVPICSL